MGSLFVLLMRRDPPGVCLDLGRLASWSENLLASPHRMDLESDTGTTAIGVLSSPVFLRKTRNERITFDGTSSIPAEHLSAPDPAMTDEIRPQRSRVGFRLKGRVDLG